ncbi:MAG: hypothetical protein ACJ79K_17820 [Gemmatimonadaceae bacterium]
MSDPLRADLLIGRAVRDVNGRRVGKIRELVAEIVEAGGAEYVVREFHLSTGGLVEALAGPRLLRVIADRLGRQPSRLVVSWRDLDLSDPERPVLRRPVASLRAQPPAR